ncbi:MAG TPA: hypothetical protein PKA53_04270, partial [Sphingobacterium sp.]|nr:hypothetical protein [Sphingobacterium sp.]
MSTKIRIFLAILTFSLIATAVTINQVVEDKDILDLDSKHLTKSIHEKEREIENIFSDSLLLKTFANSDRYPLQIREISKKYLEKFIYLYVYKDNKPIFWSSNIYVPETTDGLKKDATYVIAENRSFVIKKKQINDEITILALVVVKRFFKSTNESLRPAIMHRLVSSNNLEIADFGDNQNIKNIYSKNNTYLFSVKLNTGMHNSIFVKIQLLCWILATLTIIILIQGLCLDMAKKGYPWLSIVVLCITFFLIRLADLATNWLAENSSMEIFDPTNYTYNFFTPNLWSLLVNSVSLIWIICYCIYIKDRLKIKAKFEKGYRSLGIFYLLICFLYVAYYSIFYLLGTMVTHSSINEYNYLEIVKNHPFSIYFICVYCINVLFLILLTDFVLHIGKKISNKITHNINIQLLVLVQFLIIGAIVSNATFTNIFIALIILFRSFDLSIFTVNNISTRVITLVALAMMTSITFSKSIEATQEKHLQKNISYLKSNDDPEAISIFDSLEKDILQDDYLHKTIRFSLSHPNTDLFESYLKRKYINGYLSKYEFKSYYYVNNAPLGDYASNKIEEYREKVINSTKIGSTSNFYKLSTDFGTLVYFAVLSFPISDDEELTVILDFTNKAFTPTLPFPVVLYANTKEQQLNQQDLSGNSYAFYKNGALVTQNGSYIYPNTNTSFPKAINTYITLDDEPDFIHVLYNPNAFTTIVVSKKTQSYWEFIALASFSFLILYVLTALIEVTWIILPIFTSKNLSLSALMFRVYKLRSRIRYSTRIQTLVITSVLLAVIISGVITLISVSYQSERNRQNEKLEYISKIANKIENSIHNSSNNSAIANIENLIRDVSDVLITDFNLYNNSGKLIYTTQPKIYDQHFISQYIHIDALLNLNVLKKSEILNKESVAELKYDVSYATIRNANYQTLAYLSIPYFSSADENTNSQNTLLNTILNIYTIIIILFAFLSVFIANKITEP